MKPAGMTDKYYAYLVEIGWTEEDIARIHEDTLTMRKLMEAKKGQPEREITCSTYERAQKRLKGRVDSFMKGR